MPIIPEKYVVLTFDDAVKNHAVFVADILKKYNFNATFYVNEVLEASGIYTTDQLTENCMTWEEIAELDKAGFEIGNHTAHHPWIPGLTTDDFRKEITQIEQRCRQYGITPPSTFSYPGGGLADWAYPVLREYGYKLARVCGDKPYNPDIDNPLLVPSFGVHGTDPIVFYNAVNHAIAGQAVVLMFHGVPDIAHPWVDTPPALFEEYMQYLHENNYIVKSMRDMIPLLFS